MFWNLGSGICIVYSNLAIGILFSRLLLIFGFLMKLSAGIFLLLPSMLFVHGLQAQGMAPVRLKQEKADIAPKTFYISGVTDSMPDAKTIGTIAGEGKKRPITMDGGVADAIKSYIDHNISEDASKQAVALNVSKINFNIEKKGKLWLINAEFGVTFYACNIKLLGYYSRGQQQVDTLTDAYPDEFIRRVIREDLGKFDVWWAAHKNEYPVSQEVKVNVSIGKTVSMPDCIVYSTNRPLEISDFKGSVQNDSNENAVTYSGMTFIQTVAIEKGQFVVNVTITPYFEKTSSWFKVGEQSKILLAHEQAHFDITAIKACELVNELRHTAFTKDNYLTLIGQIERQYDEKKNEEQDAYDTETNHSKIADKQQEWQHKLSEQVKALGCY